VVGAPAALALRLSAGVAILTALIAAPPLVWLALSGVGAGMLLLLERSRAPASDAALRW
jgi:hypothetical protein